MAVVGMTILQLPTFAFRTPTDYANAMATIHGRYDATLGVAVVDTLERLQVFQIFRSTWFSIGLSVLLVSIVACTIDRTPRLWRECADIRVVQPPPFFDPRLPGRAVVPGADATTVAGILRRHRFGVRQVEIDGTQFLYGDRNRWTKLATLFTHTGLVLFLVAAAVTTKFGDEQGLVVAKGESLTVQPIGTPGLLLVKNYGFRAPGLDTGRPSDFTTDLGVYTEGREIARKTIRVNDPLSIAGYTFHQNGFGPATDIGIYDADGKPLWVGPVPMTDQAAGFPFAEQPIPGRNAAVQLLLQKQPDGTGVVLVVPYRILGVDRAGQPQTETLGPLALARGERATPAGADFSVEVRGFTNYTLLIAKRDPGQGIVWLAFASLIAGLLISFYLPRRRVWARVDPDGRAALVGRSDRYVDFVGEFGRLLDDVVASRRAMPGTAVPPT